MKTLLVIHSSGRTARSITRRLSQRFAEAWIKNHPDGTVVHRDLTVSPPPPVNERWIAAAFASPEDQTPHLKEALGMSEQLIAEVIAADVIVLGAPMYNFGMPAQLKAYIDQIVRVGRTFAFDPANAESPYLPLLESKPVMIITSVGDGALQPGGSLAHLNFLEPHLKTVLGFIGLTDLSFVRAGYDEYQDDRFKRSMLRAEAEVDRLADQLGTDLKRVPEASAVLV